MSVVEKSISKMRAASAASNLFDARTEVVGSIEEVTAEIALLGGAAAAPTSGRFVRIDRMRLRSAGFVPDQNQERRFADQYRRIKRPILMQVQVLTAARAPGARFVMMASALPGDGKTFTSINLALSIARERDVTVLIMDADVAKPHISRIFGIDVDGLSVLPAGRRHEAATELLASARMDQVITRLAACDPRRIILLDSPPLLLSSESRALVQIAGQVVLVVRAGATPRRAVEEAIGYVGQGKPLGLVLNQSLLALSEGYYGYGSYGDTNPPAS